MHKQSRPAFLSGQTPSLHTKELTLENTELSWNGFFPNHGTLLYASSHGEGDSSTGGVGTMNSFELIYFICHYTPFKYALCIKP